VQTKAGCTPQGSSSGRAVVVRVALSPLSRGVAGFEPRRPPPDKPLMRGLYSAALRVFSGLLRKLETRKVTRKIVVSESLDVHAPMIASAYI
jgi:hypothetical protein